MGQKHNQNPSCIGSCIPLWKGAFAVKDAFINRLYAFVLLAALLWVLLGAPLLPAEWQDVPHRLALMARQLPGRMASLLAHWLA